MTWYEDQPKERKIPPDIEIVLATRNRRDELLEVVKAVQAQTLGNFALRIVSNQCTDGTEHAIQDLQIEDPRIHQYIFRPRSPHATVHQWKLADFRNWGVKMGEEDGSELVAFIDDDNGKLAWYPNHLEVCVNALRQDPSRMMAYTGQNVSLVTTIDGKQVTLAQTTWLDKRGFNPRKLKKENPTDTNAMVVRRSALNAIGGFRDTLTEDWDLVQRLHKAYSKGVYSITRVTGEYLIHADSAAHPTITNTHSMAVQAIINTIGTPDGWQLATPFAQWPDHLRP